MNKDEMIKEIKAIIDDRCEAELGQVHATSKGGKVTKTVSTSLLAKDIYNAGYRKIGDDDIVINMSAYVALEKDYSKWKYEYDQNCLLRLEVHKLEKQLNQAKKETTREILHKIKDYIDKGKGGYLLIERKNIIELANALGIELEG